MNGTKIRDSDKKDEKLAFNSLFYKAIGGSCWIRTSDQLVKSQPFYSIIPFIFQRVNKSARPILVCFYTVFKSLFLLDSASRLGRKITPISYSETLSGEGVA